MNSRETVLLQKALWMKMNGRGCGHTCQGWQGLPGAALPADGIRAMMVHLQEIQSVEMGKGAQQPPWPMPWSGVHQCLAVQVPSPDAAAPVLSSGCSEQLF